MWRNGSNGAGGKLVESWPSMARSRQEQALSDRIRFLLPTLIAIILMIGLAGLLIDNLAVPARGSMEVSTWLVVGEAALVWNCVARLRLRRELARLRANRCTKCRYDMRATPHRCPECGHVRG